MTKAGIENYFYTLKYFQWQKYPSKVTSILAAWLGARFGQAADVAQETKIRLVDGPTVNEGRIEVLHNGEWGTVCDDSYNLNVANVYCRMLGYTRAEKYHHSGRWGQGDGPIWLDEVKCKGDEVILSKKC